MKIYIPFNEDRFRFIEDTTIEVKRVSISINDILYVFNDYGTNNLHTCPIITPVKKNTFVFPKGLEFQIDSRLRMSENKVGELCTIKVFAQKLGQYKIAGFSRIYVERDIFANIEVERFRKDK